MLRFWLFEVITYYLGEISLVSLRKRAQSYLGPELNVYSKLDSGCHQLRIVSNETSTYLIAIGPPQIQRHLVKGENYEVNNSNY
jgi:hypothetical protein